MSEKTLKFNNITLNKKEFLKNQLTNVNNCRSNSCI